MTTCEDNGKKSTGGHTTSGPKPEHVHIEGDWEDAVKEALKKPPPPKPDTKRPPPKERQ